MYLYMICIYTYIYVCITYLNICIHRCHGIKNSETCQRFKKMHKLTPSMFPPRKTSILLQLVVSTHLKSMETRIIPAVLRCEHDTTIAFPQGKSLKYIWPLESMLFTCISNVALNKIHVTCPNLYYLPTGELQLHVDSFFSPCGAVELAFIAETAWVSSSRLPVWAPPKYNSNTFVYKSRVPANYKSRWLWKQLRIFIR